MAPPPEYDKEPKAPDKSATTVSSEEIKVRTQVIDLPTFPDHKTANSASNNEIENNKHVESLDDGQLRALLDEAIQYKCPKDREGKSSLFKELLEEVEHQDEVSEAASRGFIARGGPHANSLQDLMAALKVESATRPVRHQPPPHSQTSVSARAIHGGSLPSGVDTSFLLAEEPARGGYLATVRCVNPPPLAERRVSASDANTPAEMELLNKSKPMFPMYTARASLEIGSGSVCSGRAVTTTTPSNQVETRSIHWATTRGPPEKIYTPKSLYQPDKPITKANVLLNALRPKCADRAKHSNIDEGSTKPFPRPGLGDINIVRVDEDKHKTPKGFANTLENSSKDLRLAQTDGGKEGVKGTADKNVRDIKPHGNDHKNIKKVVNFHRNTLENKGLSTNTVDMHSTMRSKHSNVDRNNKIFNETGANTILKYGAKIDRVPIIQPNCAGIKETSNYIKQNNRTVQITESYRHSSIKSKASQYGVKRGGGGKEDIKCITNSTADLEKTKLRGRDDAINGSVPRIHQTVYTTEINKKNTINVDSVDKWYKGLTAYTAPSNINYTNSYNFHQIETTDKNNEIKNTGIYPNISIQGSVEFSDIHDCFAPKNETKFSDEETIIHTRSASPNVSNKLCHGDICDIREYRKRVGKVVRASVSSINPRNVRSMTIGKPEPIDVQQDISKQNENSKKSDTKQRGEKIKPQSILNTSQKGISSKVTPIVKSQTMKSHCGKKQVRLELENETIVSKEEKSDIRKNDDHGLELKKVKVTDTSQCQIEKELVFEHESQNQSNEKYFEIKHISELQNVESSDIEMTFISKPQHKGRDKDCFSAFLANQQNLIKSLGSANYINEDDGSVVIVTKNNDDSSHTTENSECSKEVTQNLDIYRGKDNSSSKIVKQIDSITTTSTVSPTSEVSEYLELKTKTNIVVSEICRIDDPKPGEHDVLAEVSNNAYFFLTFPKSLTPLQEQSVQLQEIKTNNIPANVSSSTLVKRKKSESSAGKKIENRNSLRVLLLKSLLKQGGGDRALALAAGAHSQVDSTIPFSCITTPEVVASCNTTSSTVQSAVAVDPKPRSVMSSTFNGLPLSRPNYGATGSASADEYKKSLDENGNAVQGISSPISGSSQHKKPRRKKSSKNETVIKSHQIDGYQGNKDLNEVLRFIESNADVGRQGKLRGKHKDDDDKGKKRSAERRKDKEKVKRASSLEELSRTKLEDLTDAPEPPPAKPERRSWGDDARDAFYFRAPEVEPAPAPDADFQTVTKRRKPRRRDAERDERPERDPRRARPPEPRARRESAPPSDRSNDSNDDMDSVHSLPAPARAPLLPPAPAPHASYADIARTRHNIPDLIESCNFYAEGEGGGDARRADPAPAPIDADGYPALEPRAAAARRGAAKPPPPGAPAPRRERKERPPSAAECPAPDVVADRRPPVILLDSAARPRDMDGVTFGFDINEQLLGAPARRPRCDLVRDAPDAPDAPAGPDAPAVPVRAGPAALRYVPPDPPPDTHHLLQIVDYVGAAWEDVIRCGAGKVRYFSE